MSGGFFRGTSADQDTRFSNKQAKLLKSQKFAAELDHLVDMTKVKMDVIRPWIANRVTELLGFEDEVLINFIYGLLDGKEVNGKEVQISLTGFMEKNTGKFMKELWTLLLSAQKNASGVPQQFLDAKEEETRKKKVEADRIANEIQKKKEKESREVDQERLKKMDGAVEMKAAADALDPKTKTTLAKDSSIWSDDGKGPGERNGVRGRSRVPKSPQSAGHSPSPRRGSPSRSISKSHSNSRSYSDSGRRKSRSVSGSPEARRRSISSDRVHHSLRRRSITPRRRHSPQLSRSPRRRSSYLRRRSRSRSLRRSPSPLRRRRNSPSPMLRKSPSPARRHRSPSPVVRRRRSPSPVRRHWSPSPVRRRRSPSPIRRHGSPSPVRRRRSPSLVRRRRSPSPVRRRRSPSPVRRRRSPSPIRRRRSPSPVRRRRSPSPVRRRRSPSPVRRRRSPSPTRHRRSPSPTRHRRSPSPMERESLSPVRRGISPMHHRTPLPVHRASLSPVQQRYQRSPLTPPRQSTSPMQQRSPVPARMRPHTPSHHRSPSPYESSSPSPTRRRDLSPVKRKSPNEHKRSPVVSPREKFRTRESLSPAAHRHSNSLRSPLRDLKDWNDLRKRSAISPSLERSPAVSESPLYATRKRRTSEERRSFSPYDSPVRQGRPAGIDDSNLSPPQKPRDKLRQGGPDSSKELKGANQNRDHKSVSSNRSMQKEDYSPDTVAPDCHPPESRSQPDKMDLKKKNQDLKSEKSSGRSARPVTVDQEKSPILPAERRQSSYPERNHSRSSNGKDSDQRHKSENVTMFIEKVDHGNRSDTVDSGSEESYKHRNDNKEKRKHKYEREEAASDDDYSYDSEAERKQAKRRRKEEKKLRKEEKRRRRDERRRRREERRAEKLKLKNHNDADGSDGEHVPRRESHPGEDEATESEQKRLEIELRNKALESIKAKKISSR